MLRSSMYITRLNVIHSTRAQQCSPSSITKAVEIVEAMLYWLYCQGRESSKNNALLILLSRKKEQSKQRLKEHIYKSEIWLSYEGVFNLFFTSILKLFNYQELLTIYLHLNCSWLKALLSSDFLIDLFYIRSNPLRLILILKIGLIVNTLLIFYSFFNTYASYLFIFNV